MNALRAVLNTLMVATLPFWGGLVVQLFAFYNLFRGDFETRRQFVHGKSGFFYDIRLSRKSGLVLFINWAYLILAPIWAGPFLVWSWFCETNLEEVKEVFLFGDCWFWEV